MLFVPIWDMNHLKRVGFQYVTVALIALNTLIYFVFETHFLLHAPASFVDAVSFKPRDVETFHGFLTHLPEDVTLLTYMFVHGSFWHLFGNMAFLFVFGDNVEDALGHGRFIVFYLLCGIVAAIAHSLMTHASDVPLIGASGAVAGVVGAYVMLHPNVRVWVLFPVPFISFLPFRFSAALVIGLWLAYQIISAVVLADEPTAWWAHVGGFFAGALLIVVMRRRGVPLFDMATGIR